MPLFLDVGFHSIKPAHWEMGGRQERGGGRKGVGGFKRRRGGVGEKKPSEIQKKWFLIQREAGNRAHTQTETPLHGRQASWWLLALLLQQETPPPRSLPNAGLSEAATGIFLFCFPPRSYRLVVAGTCCTAVEMRNISEMRHPSTRSTNICFNSKDWQWTRYYQKIFPVG